MLSPWGGKNISFTREQVVGMGRRGHDPLGECNSVCMSNPECMGLDSAASSVWRTYTRYETSWQTPTQPRAIIVTDYNDDARCTYYYGEPTGQIKTKNVKSYKNVSYSGVI